MPKARASGVFGEAFHFPNQRSADGVCGVFAVFEVEAVAERQTDRVAVHQSSIAGKDSSRFSRPPEQRKPGVAHGVEIDVERMRWISAERVGV